MALCESLIWLFDLISLADFHNCPGYTYTGTCKISFKSAKYIYMHIVHALYETQHPHIMWSPIIQTTLTNKHKGWWLEINKITDTKCRFWRHSKYVLSLDRLVMQLTKLQPASHSNCFIPHGSIARPYYFLSKQTLSTMQLRDMCGWCWSCYFTDRLAC